MNVTEGIELAGAIGSVAVAVGTGALAWATFRLAKFTKATVADAKKAIDQADQHHKENLRPLCLVEFLGANSVNPFGNDFNIRTSIPGPQYRHSDNKPYISIAGRLVNKGLGPAKDVVVYLNMGNSVDGLAYWLTHPVVVCGVIGAGEVAEIEVAIAQQNITTRVVNCQRVPVQILESLAQDASEVVLRYRDVFDETFRTVHARGFPQNIPLEVAVAKGNVALEAQQSARQDKPTPVFLKGEQPWQTLADMSPTANVLENS